jgi:hypothetical protein
MADPDKIVADIDRKQNEEDLANLNKYVKEPAKAAFKKMKEGLLGTDEQNKAAQERMDEAAKKKDRESIRVDRSPKYANSQMDSTRKQLDDQAKAFKLERDKASKDYDKAIGKAKGGMIKSSASKRADGCAIRGKTRA